jgi:hypothetical protein
MAQERCVKPRVDIPNFSLGGRPTVVKECALGAENYNEDWQTGKSYSSHK